MLLLEIVFILLIPFCLLQVIAVKNVIFLRPFHYIFIWVLFLIAAFRVTSPDYANYEAYYTLLSSGVDYRDVNIVAADPIFAYINYFFALFTKDPIIIFVFFASTSVAINLSCYKKYSPYFFLSILFYVSHTYVAREIMQIRAGLACALCLYSIRYIFQKRLYCFFLIIFSASAIHLGALVFSLAYFIGRLQVSKKTILLILIAAVGIGLLYPFGHIFKQIPTIDFLQRIQYYNESKYGEAAGVLNNPIIIKGILIIVFCLYFHDSLIKLNKYYLLCFNLYFFSVIWYLLWNDFEIFAARIATFFSITEVLLLSYIPLLMKSAKNKLLSAFLLVMFATLILFLNLYTGKWDEVILPWAI